MGRRFGIKFINLFSIYIYLHSAKAAEFKCSPSWRAICAAASRVKRLAYHAIDKTLIFYSTPVVLFYQGQHAKVKRVYKRALQFMFRSVADLQAGLGDISPGPEGKKAH